MKICCFTWNTHGINILPGIEESADITILSLQECIFIPNKNIKVENQKTFSYKCSLFGLKTIILSNENLNLNFYKVGLGPFGLLNKGFIVTVINNQIIHINCHLSAHEHNSHRRSKELDIILSFVAYLLDNSASISIQNNLNNTPNHFNNFIVNNQLNNIKNNINTVIITGDFNFRNEYESFSFKNEFSMFQEMPITFKPTYKYNGKELNEKRKPAYCDRIMYSSIFKCKGIKYTSLESVLSSDHKPLICLFEIDKSVRNSNKLELNVKSDNLIFERIRTSIYLKIMYLLPVFVLIILLLKLIRIKNNPQSKLKQN